MIYDIYFAPLEYEFNLYYSLGKFSKQNDIFLIFSQKIGFDISCKLSPLETVCMICQSLFSLKI